MRIDEIKIHYPQAYDIGAKLAANPQRTLSERQEADELRQHAERSGLTPLVTQVAVELAEANTHRVTAQWTPGNTVTRSYATLSEAKSAAETLMSGPARKWNVNGALVLPAGRDGFWVR